MQIIRPLPEKYSEFSIRKSVGVQEFRIERRKTASWRLIWTLPVFGALCLAIVAQSIYASWIPYIGGAILFLILLYQINKVNYESFVVIPSHGVQLETQHGFQFPLFGRSTKQFIPFSAIKLLFIHEGLYGWNVRYFLAIQCKDQSGYNFSVVFPSTLPYFPVLKIVYAVAMASFQET